MKIGRNDYCPCGSGKKYKACCLGKRDWETILSRPDFAMHLSLRGKNMFFLSAVAELLGIDPNDGAIDWASVKNRISEDHVHSIHLLLQSLWLNKDDLRRTLLSETDGLSGLYSGHYTPEAMTSSIARHALYSESILVFDPFIFPGSVRPQYDPVLHPEQYVSHTIKCLYIWFSMAPWIHAGVLKFIRSPTDFDPALRIQSLHEEKDRFARHWELRDLMEKIKANINIRSGEIGWITEYFMLAHPNSVVNEVLTKGGFSQKDINEFMRYRERMKKDHPYYTERRQNEIHVTKMGECYGISKRVAEISGSFLVTDNDFRWKMIEIDRRESGVDDSAWEPFSRTISKAPLKILENITLDDCLRLRKDGLLHRMRSFLRRVWAVARIGGDGSRGTAEQFAAELEHEVALAEQEWQRIDTRLLKWFGAETATALALTPQIGLANVAWLAASLATAGIANVIGSSVERRTLPKRMPGAFFLGCRNKSE